MKKRNYEKTHKERHPESSEKWVIHVPAVKAGSGVRFAYDKRVGAEEYERWELLNNDD